MWYVEQSRCIIFVAVDWNGGKQAKSKRDLSWFADKQKERYRSERLIYSREFRK